MDFLNKPFKMSRGFYRQSISDYKILDRTYNEILRVHVICLTTQLFDVPLVRHYRKFVDQVGSRTSGFPLRTSGSHLIDCLGDRQPTFSTKVEQVGRRTSGYTRVRLPTLSTMSNKWNVEQGWYHQDFLDYNLPSSSFSRCGCIKKKSELSELSELSEFSTNTFQID